MNIEKYYFIFIKNYIKIVNIDINIFYIKKKIKSFDI